MAELWWVLLHVRWNDGGVLGEERECSGGAVCREEPSMMNQ